MVLASHDVDLMLMTPLQVKINSIVLILQSETGEKRSFFPRKIETHSSSDFYKTAFRSLAACSDSQPENSCGSHNQDMWESRLFQINNELPKCALSFPKLG